MWYMCTHLFFTSNIKEIRKWNTFYSFQNNIYIYIYIYYINKIKYHFTSHKYSTTKTKNNFCDPSFILQYRVEPPLLFMVSFIRIASDLTSFNVVSLMIFIHSSSRGFLRSFLLHIVRFLTSSSSKLCHKFSIWLITGDCNCVYIQLGVLHNNQYLVSRAICLG